ncbi:TylF/MycF family methyltransferase [Alphaproteobacteria bacterium]|nr:TylF/MycF family methyltransferase [Alphaproteobacteria bacterium]
MHNIIDNIPKSEKVEYNPSFSGRLARIVIPILHCVLPFSMYTKVYDTLYNTHKKMVYLKYFSIVLMSKIFASEEQKLKTSLTLKMLPFSMGGPKALENAFEVTALIEKKEVQGSLVECGVAEGGTAAMMALTSQKLGKKTRTKWFFDSYEGLPEPTPEDYEEGKTGHFIRPLPRGSCLGTIEQVQDLMFNNLNFTENDVHLIKGWFQNTIPKYKDKVSSIAILRLDGDWYESTKIPLENLYDNVNKGGYIIIDDYATCFGSRKAVDEFRKQRNITTPLLLDGRGGVWFEKSEQSK